LFAEDVKIFRAINSVEGFFLLQSDIAGTQSLCAANCVVMNAAFELIIYGLKIVT